MKTLRVIKYSLLFGLGALAASLLLVDTSHLATLVSSQIESGTAKSDWRVQFTEPSLAVVGLDSVSLSIAHKRFPLIFKIDESNVRIPLAALFSGVTSASFKGLLYTGELKGAASQDGELQTINLTFSGIRLKEHPQLLGLGIMGGTLSGDAAIELTSNQLSRIDSTITLERINKPDKTTLTARTLSLPFDITVPPIQDLNLKLRVFGDESALKLEGIDLSSSLGSAKGQTSFSMAKGTVTSMSGEFSVQLSTAGVSFFGPFLPLASSGTMQSTDKDFSIALSGSPRAPRAIFRKPS